MNAFGTVVMMTGIVVCLLAQLYGGIKSFKVSIKEGMLCIVVPAYILISAKKYGYYKQMTIAWLTGATCMVIGTVLLS